MENGDAAPGLAAAVQESPPARASSCPVGIAGAIAWRAVTAGDWKTSTHPEFIADSSRSLVVDGGPLPARSPTSRACP